MKQKIFIDNLTDLSSHWKYMPGKQVTIINKTLDAGLYTQKARNIVVYDRDENVEYKLPSAKPVTFDRIFKSNKVLPKKVLNNTLAGILYAAKMYYNCTRRRNNNRFSVSYEVD